MKKRKSKSRSNARAAAGIDAAAVDSCYGRIREILASPDALAARAINRAPVAAYWRIGREIVEQEKRVSGDAVYGRKLLIELSQRLTRDYGRGYSRPNLRDMRKFFITYADRSPDREVAQSGDKDAPPEQAVALLTKRGEE